MPINNVTTATQIRANTLGSVTGFNSLRSTLSTLSVTKYGAQSIATQPVSPGVRIRPAEWLTWQNDFQRVSVHQNHSLVNFVQPLPLTGRRVAAATANQMIEQINVADTNFTKVAPQQLGSAPQGSSSRTTSWNSEILQLVRYTWASPTLAEIYFNLGSYFSFTIESTLPSSSAWPNLDSTWQSLIQIAKSRLQNFKYGYSQWTDPTSTLYANFTGSSLDWSTSSNSSIAISGGNIIKLSAVRSGNLLNITLRLTPNVGPGQVIEVDVNATFTSVYSRGDVPVGGVFGFSAPRPTPALIQGFGEGGGEGPPPETKELRVSPLSMTFSFQSGQQSAYQTVTLSNVGNTALQISAINFSSDNGPVTPSFNSFPSFPLTINGGANRTFQLRYTGNTVGTFNNSFTVVPVDLAPVTVSTQQIVSAVPFDFTLSPDSWNPSITSTNGVLQQKFSIIPSDEVAAGTNYTASWSSGSSLGWTITNTTGGPTVSINPAGLSNGTYQAVIQVVHRGITKTASINLTVNVTFVNRNLGTWLSGLQKQSGVVGMSYDIINNQRYLTIGYGMGADGSIKIATEANADAYYAQASVANLGINGDTGSIYGPVVYKMSNFALTQSSLLSDYGVWVRDPNSIYGADELGPNTTGVAEFNVTRLYEFSTTVAGTYNWEFSAALGGRFSINNQAIKNLSAGDSNSWSSVSTGTVNLGVGKQAVTWECYPGSDPNQPNGIAIRITYNGQQIWSTLDAVRTTPAYQNWTEVYRIPIASSGAAAAETIYIGGNYGGANWRVKNYQQCAGFAYGDVFEFFMFKIENDGFGNLRIIFGDPPDISYSGSIWNFIKTTGNIPPSFIDFSFDIRYLTYLDYYLLIDTEQVVRFKSIPKPSTFPNPNTGNTYKLVGFNANGTLNLVQAVTQVVQASGTGGGSGGGGGGGRPGDDTIIIINQP